MRTSACLSSCWWLALSLFAQAGLRHAAAQEVIHFPTVTLFATDPLGSENGSTDILINPIPDLRADDGKTVQVDLLPQPGARFLAGTPGNAVVTIADPLANASIMEFLEPTNNAVFSTLDEIPVMLRAFAPDDVFLAGEVFANNLKIADVSFCCWLCPCAQPVPGMETLLQIPVPWEPGGLPPRTWQGWTNVQAGDYRLTARAYGGSVLESHSVNITVLDLTLNVSVNADGSVLLVIPQGSLVPGGYEAEFSQDLCTWTRLGSFLPGNVAAFFYDDAPSGESTRGFYRSVWMAPHQP